MITGTARSTEGFGWWLLVGSGLVILAALFSAAREKPVVVFAAGFGLVMGMALRLLAQSLHPVGDRQRLWLTVLIVGGGFVLSFVPSYRRAAQSWNRASQAQPSNPLAAALLKQAAEHTAVPEVPPYSIEQYLARRIPGLPSPWPLLLFGAEWVLCITIAALCIGVGQPRPPGADQEQRHEESPA